VPKVWTESVETHRVAVRTAILDATSKLVTEKGLLSVTMSDLAEAAGIGRATLYKYYSGVEPILVAWHERTVSEHLGVLVEIAAGPGEPLDRLTAVLEAYAEASGARHGDHVAAVLHRGDHVAMAHDHLRGLLSELLTEGAAVGQVRSDVPPRELASYCIHALAAAGDARSRAAVRRLVSLTVDGISAQE
jgi:AcrR family transcriptional regulator